MAEPFLIGENMTGGYGPVDILQSCQFMAQRCQQLFLHDFFL